MDVAMQQGNLTVTRNCNTVEVSVIICAYTCDRWQQTRAAVRSVTCQRPGPGQILLVVDHNGELEALARKELPGVTVIENEDAPGLSGARNTGLRAADQPIAVFLDDDAEARPGWLASLIEPYRIPHVVATGGSVHPKWQTGRPRWMPSEFDWVVGCSYLGLPEEGGPIRNPIGANMSMRTELARKAGGFAVGIGRVGKRPRGCEETELAIRLTSRNPGSAVHYVPAAAVDHHVSPERARLTYFMRRCWHEGKSKAAVAQLVGASAALQRERRQTVSVIPRALMRELRRGTAGDRMALMRLAVSIGGLMTAALGYVTGTCQANLIQRSNENKVQKPSG